LCRSNKLAEVDETYLGGVLCVCSHWGSVFAVGSFVKTLDLHFVEKEIGFPCLQKWSLELYLFAYMPLTGSNSKEAIFG
jgi:hypothetical protein